MSRNNSQVSNWNNVIVDSINKIQVSGTPPVLQNVLINNTQEGLVYIGAGIAKAVEVKIENITVQHVRFKISPYITVHYCHYSTLTLIYSWKTYSTNSLIQTGSIQSELNLALAISNIPIPEDK